MARFDVDFAVDAAPVANPEATTALLDAMNATSDAASSSSGPEAVTMLSSTALDDKGRPWWKGQVCYQVWPMSFKDSNGGQSGTFIFDS